MWYAESLSSVMYCTVTELDISAGQMCIHLLYIYNLDSALLSSFKLMWSEPLFSPFSVNLHPNSCQASKIFVLMGSLIFQS